MNFRKVTIRLTPEQVEELQPITTEFEVERRGGVLGQAFLIPNLGRTGEADFYFLNEAAFNVMNHALAIARKA